MTSICSIVYFVQSNINPFNKKEELMSTKNQNDDIRDAIIAHEELSRKFFDLMLNDKLYYAEWLGLIDNNPLAYLALANLIENEEFEARDVALVFCKLLQAQWDDLRTMAENNAALRRELDLRKVKEDN